MIIDKLGVFQFKFELPYYSLVVDFRDVNRERFSRIQDDISIFILFLLIYGLGLMS